MKELINLSCNGKKVHPKASYDHTTNMVILSFYNADKIFKYTYKSVHDPKGFIFKVSEKDYETIVFEIEKEMNEILTS